MIYIEIGFHDSSPSRIPDGAGTRAALRPVPAASCKVTQSTFSAGIKQMEESLGVLVVERGQRFLGLTPEGEKVLSGLNMSSRITKA